VTRIRLRGAIVLHTLFHNNNPAIPPGRLSIHSLSAIPRVSISHLAAAPTFAGARVHTFIRRHNATYCGWLGRPDGYLVLYDTLDLSRWNYILTCFTVANNFWGKDDAGVTPLLTRLHNAKVAGDELHAFYTARAAIEAEYAKKLSNLAKKPLGSTESGTLRMSMDVVKAETESMGKQHGMIAQQMKNELEDPLGTFAGGIKERRKMIQAGIEKLLKTKNSQTMVVNKTRDRFEQDCLKIKGYLAQGHMVMGQEERKNKTKLEKTQAQMSTNSNEYEMAVKILEETTGRWNREWKAACDKFQDLEEERVDFFKSSLWSFANISSTVCVSDDQSCEKVRLSLEDCDVEKDITNFIQDFGTGQEIPDPPKYINFCRGDVDDNVSTADSDDGAYSVAQFQRTMNPTFRSSSPQPSTFESHHDPDSSLREEMGLPKNRQSLDMFDGRASSGSARMLPPGIHQGAYNGNNSVGSNNVPPLNPSMSSQHNASMTSQHNASMTSQHNASMSSHNNASISSQHNPYSDVAQVPHNPYPTDGMTQFCRPESVRSNHSPIRNGSNCSQEQHSDYTNPTSLSDLEPQSGQQSPIKDYNGSALSQMSNEPEKPVQKKKSGFFNSPFRRRSFKKNENARASSAAPTNRNTWAPAANTRGTESASTSPVKPAFGAGNRANTWQAKQPSPTPDAEQVDPRATNYQLGVGDNVFDVASPEPRAKASPTKRDAAQPSQDPIAQALAELKGVTKQASVRQSADRHYGMSTPAPALDSRGVPVGAVPMPFANKAIRNTPPPAYDQPPVSQPPVSRLGAPQPAHTSRDMRKTTERYVAQKQDMFTAGGVARPTSRAGQGQPQGRAPAPDARAPSPVPAPLRSTSPRPSFTGDPRQSYGGASPNPYQAAAGRPRANSTSPVKPAPNYGSGYASRGNSPGFQAQPPRAASPNPAYARPGSSMGAANSRPPSSRGGDTGGAMALQLAPGGDAYAGGQQRSARPQSSYYAEGSQGWSSQQLATRNRSQSQSTQRQMTKDGRPIIHYCKFLSYPSSPINATHPDCGPSSRHVHVPSRYSGRAFFRQRRHSRCLASARRRVVGG
jgi:hypothetical protein